MAITESISFAERFEEKQKKMFLIANHYPDEMENSLKKTEEELLRKMEEELSRKSDFCAECDDLCPDLCPNFRDVKARLSLAPVIHTCNCRVPGKARVLKPSEVFLSGETHLLQKIEITVPIRTVSEANTHEHWTKTHARKKQQRNAIISFLKLNCHNVNLPCYITLTRIAPRALDEGDNLPMAFKHIRDVVASFLTKDDRPGIADSDDRLTWEYKQEKGKPKEYAIRITFGFF